MEYNPKSIFEKAKEAIQEINEISLTDGCQLISERFNNETEMVDDLIPKLNGIIKQMYGCNVLKYQKERHYKILQYGYFNMYADIYIQTDGEFDIIIECKNPKQKKYDIISSFSQIMSYEFIFSKIKTEKKVKFVLATSCFDFVYFEFMKMFNIKYDIILHNKKCSGIWINDL